MGKTHTSQWSERDLAHPVRLFPMINYNGSRRVIVTDNWKDNPLWQKFISMQEPQQFSLGLELEKWAFSQPQKPAIVFDRQTLTYAEFNVMANQYAHFFASLGFDKGDIVALVMDNRPEYMAAVAGLSKLGVITSLIHIGLRGEVLAYAVNVVEARAVIVGHELLDVFDTIAERIRLRSPALIFVEGDDPDISLPPGMQHLSPLLEQQPAANPVTTGTINSDDVLAYMYTSGAAGSRKAVRVFHKRFLGTGLRVCMQGHMTADSVQYACVPLYLNSGFCVCFGSLIISGSTMALRPKFSVSRFWSEIRRYGADFWMAIGEMARYLYRQPAHPDDADNPLKVMLCNGMWGNLIEPFKQRFALDHVIELYGTSEGVGVFVNYDETPGMCGNLSFNGLRQGEVVSFDHDTEDVIYGSDGHLIKCTLNEVGVLLGKISHLNDFPGYINDPDATDSKIIKNAFEPGDSYFNTGDLVRLHENDYISFVDRLGDTYRWKGKTVSSSNVADVIVKFFGGIDDAIVYGIKLAGFEGRCGMAVIQMLEGEKLDWPRFSDHMNRRMPEHARPRFLRMLDSQNPISDLAAVKNRFKQQGLDIDNIKDPLYFYDTAKDQYVRLTRPIYDEILAGNIYI